jgi:competence protein ComEC
MKLIRQLLTFILIAISTKATKKEAGQEFIVWNVGQGLWTTWVTDNQCLHFDAGGEYYKIISRVTSACKYKYNLIHLSHWDSDHINFVKNFSRNVDHACLATMPGGIPTNPAKQKWLADIDFCSNGIRHEPIDDLWNSSKKKMSSNEASHVFYIRKLSVLIPGDSTKKEEMIWSQRIKPNLNGLVLGHHGSKTSTSDELLNHAPNLHWAVASARQSRYGHPHKQIIKALQKRKIPLLKTEDWGTFHFLQ